MRENGKISLRQFSILVAFFTVGDSLLVLPSGMAFQVKEDAWISAIISVGIGLLAVCLFTFIASRNPEMTLVEYNNKILGKMLGTVLSLLFVAYLMLCAAANIREIGDFMTTQIMPETPIQAIHILFLCIVVMAVRLGLETFARAGEIFFPGFVLFFILFVLFLLPQVHTENIQPVFGEGFISILRGSIIPATFSPLELVVFLMIMPYVNQPKHILKSFTMGALIGGIALILLILLSILVLGADSTASHMYPSYNLAKKISIGHFLERIEAILSLMWFVTIFFKIVLFFYAITLGLSQVFKLKEYKVLTMPCAVFIMVLSICIAPNVVYYNDAILWYWPFLDMTFDVLFPSFLLGVYILRKKVFKLQ